MGAYIQYTHLLAQYAFITLYILNVKMLDQVLFYELLNKQSESRIN